VPEDYIQFSEYIVEGAMREWRKEAAIFKTLGHPARLAILDVLRGGEQCVCHLESALGMRQAYLSQQLAVLKEAGLIRDRRDGWNMYYRVIHPDIFTLIEKAAGPPSRPGRASGRHGRAHAPVANCPCPKCSPRDTFHPHASSAPAASKAGVKV
jgi:DNA-binding transcriptional ArsR family regulator